MTSRQVPSATPLGLQDVTIDDKFWNPYLELVHDQMLDYQYEQLEESGCLDNFRIVADQAEGDFQGMWFEDSDAYKWIEAASYVLATHDASSLRNRVDDVITIIEAAQADDGYLDTWIMIEHPDRRWTNLSMGHELYCAGHLIEAGVAHHMATGDETLLAVAREVADCIDATFGPHGREGAPGHEEIELALLKLFRATGESRYLDLAIFFIEQRGGALQHEFEDPEGRAGTDGLWEGARSVFFTDDEYDGSYAQDHAPIREHDTVEGHAVRAMYLYTAVADLVLETGDGELGDTLERLWENMTERRMYVTGGIGSTHEGERFTEDYHLPTETSYAETCAAVGSIFWTHRLFQLTGESRFPELIERVLYNGFLAGISLDATEFFYANPLAVGPDGHALAGVDPNRFSNERHGWFECACCPPNAARLIASLGQYIYARSTSDTAVYVNQFIGSETSFRIGDTDITLRQETDLPWDGIVTLSVDVNDPTDFELRIRIPEWCTGGAATVAGETVAVDPNGEYLDVDRTWHSGDELVVSFDVGPELLCSHPSVTATRGKTAIRRGPIIYCLEGVDHDRPLSQYTLPMDASLDATHRPDLLRGVTVITGEARVPGLDEWTDVLYRPMKETGYEDTTITAVPYYAWANREPGELRVWIETSGVRET